MSTNNESIENIEEVKEVEDANCEKFWPPKPSKSKCVAQVSPTAKEVKVYAPDCCKNIIVAGQDLSVSTKEVNASIIKGTVKCGSDGNKYVEGAIVVATTGSGASANSYVGITNSNGEYSIVVPAPITGNARYSVAAYLVSPCSTGDNICKPGNCESGCR